MATAQVSAEEYSDSSDSSENLDNDDSSHEQGPKVPDPKLTDGRCFQWQLNNGNSWMNIDNDHIIEINYSLPHTKGITIYNTPYGAVSLDFNRMRVLGKNLMVRRLDDGRSKWFWYCMLSNMWKNYVTEDATGNTPLSEAIEDSFQRQPRGSFTFSRGGETYEINFRDMKQVGKKRKRAVRRRPVYREKQQEAMPDDCYTWS